MIRKLLMPDGFAVGLFCFGLILFFAPLMRVPGAIAVVAAVAYWIIILVVRFVYRQY
jgi:hypothetical protein